MTTAIKTKHILITGATGVLGSSLVPLFIAEDNTKIILLIRADNFTNKINKLIKFWQLLDTSKILFIKGDVSLQDFGLSEKDKQYVLDNVTHIVHAAASVKLNMTQDEAYKSCVLPVLNMISLAKRCNNLIKIDYVSTLGVAGKTIGSIPEKLLTHVPGFHSTYESSKYIAEHVIKQHALPITIHRPSMIIGNSANGKILNYQIFYYIVNFLSGKHTFGLVPNLKNMIIDVIPVDYVARVIHWSNNSTITNDRILHLCAGPNYSISFLQLIKLISTFKQSTGEALPKLRLLPVWVFNILFFNKKTIRRFLAYTNYKQYFSNTETVNLLRSNTNIKIPNIETSIINSLIYQKDNYETQI